MNHAILRTENLSVGYRHGHAVLEKLELGLMPGHIAVLAGANGTGKSTLLSTLSGALKPLGGNIEIDGRSLGEIPRSGLARLLSIVTTDPTMAGGLTVRETVAIGRQPYTGVFGSLDPEDRRIVAEAMEATGIAAKAESPLAELSDGERQKAMIARAVAQRTPLMLLDEPTNFLDVAARIDIMNLLRRLIDSSEGRMGVLLSTHDLAAALAVADDIWALDAVRQTIVSGPKDTPGLLDIPFAHRGINAQQLLSH